MAYLITLAELEDLTEVELHSKFCQIVNDMARRKQVAQECPLAQLTLRNIQEVLMRRRLKDEQSRFAYRPKG